MRKINGERRYGVWAGFPKGNAENPEHCIEEVTSNDRAAMRYQCSRKRGHGPDGLYCKPHSEKHLSEPIATWYYTDKFGFTITPEPVYKETEKTITIKSGSRLSATNKRGYYDYWPTREAAIEHLRKRLVRMQADLRQAESAFNETVNKK